jgi:hypothetical protein
MNIIGILVLMLAEGLSQVNNIVAKKWGAIGHL